MLDLMTTGVMPSIDDGPLEEDELHEKKSKQKAKKKSARGKKSDMPTSQPTIISNPPPEATEPHLSSVVSNPPPEAAEPHLFSVVSNRPSEITEAALGKGPDEPG